MDIVYNLPYARTYHPMYEAKGGIPDFPPRQRKGNKDTNKAINYTKKKDDDTSKSYSKNFKHKHR